MISSVEAEEEERLTEDYADIADASNQISSHKVHQGHEEIDDFDI
jgi:hypothetical protein